MKKQLTLSLLLLLVSLVLLPSVHAQTKTASPSQVLSPTEKASSDSSSIINKLKQIEQLKEKIATKVAELREKDKTGVSGTVKKIDGTTITLNTRDGEKKVTYADDIVVYEFTKDGRTDQKISKIKEGNYISVIGIFNEDKSAVLGKIVYIEEASITFFGKVVDIDRDNYTLTVKTKDESEVVDIETTTRIYTYGASGKMEKGGFSKVVLGDPIHVVGTARLKESNKVTGGKLYVFPLLNQTEETITPTVSPTGKTASTSGTPKTTPTPTKKVTPTPTKKPISTPTPA